MSIIISGTVKTSQITEQQIIGAKDYNGKIIIKLTDGKWYYYEPDRIQADVDGDPIQRLINKLREKDKE